MLKEAERRDNAFARERRDALRELLCAGARKGALPWGTTCLADFDADGTGAEAAEFIDLDEDLDRDSEFKPIYKYRRKKIYQQKFGSIGPMLRCPISLK